MVNVLLVDDEHDIRELIYDSLVDEGISVHTTKNAKETLDYLQINHTPNLIILDIWLEGSNIDGVGLLKKIKTMMPLVPVIMISGHGNIKTAINCIKNGAYDFIEKPFKLQKLLILVKRALEVHQLVLENKSLKISNDIDYELVGESKAINNIRSAALLAAPTNSRIMITGDAGVGKEVLARFIHQNSPKENKTFFRLHVATLKAETFEIEFNGDLKTQKKGIKDLVAGGTLFIDDLSTMPLESQNKLLNLLQAQDKDNTPEDMRIITSVCSDFKSKLEQGTINQSLFYRLNVVPLHMPSLCQRKEDIKQLFNFFVECFVEKMSLPRLNVLEETFTVLMAYDWPGNVRQLKNTVEWLAIMSLDHKEITPEDLPQDIMQSINDKHKNWNPLSSKMISQQLKQARETFEKEYIHAQINRFDGNISKTANFIGIDRASLHRKMKNLGIDTASNQ